MTPITETLSAASAANLVALFADLEPVAAPVLRVIACGLLTPANDIAPARPTAGRKVIRYDEIRTKQHVQFGRPYGNEVVKGARAEVIPGSSVRIFGVCDHRAIPAAYDLAFKVGDYAVYGSYNLVYTGKITKVGPKTIAIAGDSGVPHQLDLATFVQRNWDYNANDIAARNHAWMD